MDDPTSFHPALFSQTSPSIIEVEEDDDYPALIAGHNGGSPSRHGSNQVYFREQILCSLILFVPLCSIINIPFYADKWYHETNSWATFQLTGAYTWIAVRPICCLLYTGKQVLGGEVVEILQGSDLRCVWILLSCLSLKIEIVCLSLCWVVNWLLFVWPLIWKCNHLLFCPSQIQEWIYTSISVLWCFLEIVVYRYK